MNEHVIEMIAAIKEAQYAEQEIREAWADVMSSPATNTAVEHRYTSAVNYAEAAHRVVESL